MSRKLTLYQAIQIRAAVRRKEATPQQMAKKYGMPLPFIQTILRREIYRLNVAGELKARCQGHAAGSEVSSGAEEEF